jgi:hypothetical protein
MKANAAASPPWQETTAQATNHIMLQQLRQLAVSASAA